MNLDQLTNDDGLMVRSLRIRSKDTAKREITGLGVPYGETYDSGWGWKERFEPGAIDLESNAKLYWQHREVIGRVVAKRDTADGLEITAKISDTAQGRDAWTLLEDGAVDSLSIGFEPVEWRTERADDGTETIIHTKVRDREFSLVSFPAYETAKISATRAARRPGTQEKKETPVETETLTRDALEPLESGMEEIRRSIGKLEAGTSAPAPSVPEFRSIGAFVQAVASGDETAMNLHRDFTGGTLSDAIVKESWMGEYFKLVEDRRRIVNTFGRKSLPATGMTVEYAKIKSDTTQVAKQENEGDTLAGPGKIVFDTASAPVETDGGYTELSFQAVQRATISTLDTLWKAMILKYARATEMRARTAYFKLMDDRLALAPETAPDAALDLSAAADADDFLDGVIDAALIFEERGFALEGMHASVDQFKRLNRLTDGDGRRLMNVYGTGMNMVGELNLKALDGSLANLPVSLVGSRATRGRLAFYDSVALETLESPGAPFQLQDENIINLTKQLSLYGYTAITTPFPEAVLPVRLGA